MQRDERGLALSTDSAEAAARFDLAVEHYLKYHADTMGLVGAALDADPHFLMGLCFKAYLLLFTAIPAYRTQVAELRIAAEAAAPAATRREQLHVRALAAWEAGAVDQAFAAWREILDQHPTDLLALQISDRIWFRHGQTDAILEQADRLAPAWGAGLPGYDSFQTIWAFAHEEVGDTSGAERAVDAALERDRTNYFAHHVKAHVFDTDRRVGEGREWLASQVSHWSHGNNLIHHLWWHRALMELDLGEIDAVLASYDANVRNLDAPMTRAAPDHYVDLQNATSLLWRLELSGVQVGNRWQELAEKAERRMGDAVHLLLVPHLMLALAATGRNDAATRFLAALREIAGGSLWTAPAIAEVVIPVCDAALAHRRGDHARVVELLWPIRQQIRLLGGSNAQRDMFLQMLADAAMRVGRRDMVAEMLRDQIVDGTGAFPTRAGYAAAASWFGRTL
jgi:tetratricopeptide (TPR) repeat protein